MVELAEPPTSFRLGRVAALYSATREQVEDPELAFAKTFVAVHTKVQAGRLHRELGGLHGASIRRGNDHLRRCGARSQPLAECRRLFDAERRQWHVHVALGDVERFDIASPRRVPGDVAKALSMTQQPQLDGIADHREAIPAPPTRQPRAARPPHRPLAPSCGAKMAAMRLFVSYSRSDAQFVERLTAALEADGHDVWVDTEDIAGSQQWRASIVAGVQRADAVLLVMSPRSMTSPNVEREVTVAAEESRRIVPLVLEPAEMTGSILFELAGTQQVLFAGRDFAIAMEELRAELRKLSADPVSPYESTASLPPTPPRDNRRLGAV